MVGGTAPVTGVFGGLQSGQAGEADRGCSQGQQYVAPVQVRILYTRVTSLDFHGTEFT
jgi:hypothetical protein